MFCPQCGQPVSEQDIFCRMCGNNLNRAASATRNEEAETSNISLQNEDAETSNTSLQNGQATISNTALILLGIGAGIAILICAVSLAVYGRVYFFDGYAITKFAWIAAIGFAVCGVIAFVKNFVDFDISTLLVNGKKRFVAALLLICVVPTIFIIFGNRNGYSTGKTQTNNKETTSSTSSQTVLTKVQKEGIAEDVAMRKIWEILKVRYASRYHVESTRYRIGAITYSYGEYTVNGTLYLYNKYGNIEDTVTFSVGVYVHDDGTYKVNDWDLPIPNK